MKRLSFILLFMLVSICNYASVVEGTVVNASSMPVANATIYITDSVNSSPSLTLTAVTNASGYYSATLPGTVTNGTTLIVSTASCGIMLYNYHTYQGASITSNFTICSFVPPLGPDTVSGWVSLPSASNPANTTPGYPAIVYLIEEDYDSVLNATILTAVDSTNTDALGNYMFVYTSNTWRPLHAKAALLPNSPDYANYLPTYNYSELNWSTAGTVNGMNGTAHILMVVGINPGGPGFIGGSVLQGANKTTGVGDPLNKRLLLLTTLAGQAVAYTYSNASGDFSFSNLAYGTYLLFGDAWGKINPPLTVTISAAKPSVDNIIFEENSTKFQGHFDVTSVNNIALNSMLHVFPNPATDKLSIEGLGKIKGTKNISVISINGAVIYQSNASTETLSIPVSNWANGIYMLKIQTEEGNAMYKITK